ncbi:MAG: FAD-binding protein [Planctomycetales bacterium]|nr:FAD-binding protein [Planctomycetales bacterium]
MQIFAACRKFGAPITSRGGGTSLAGQCCNVAVVIDYSKHMHHVLEIDAKNRLARVEPGCKLDTLRNAAEEYRDITSMNYCLKTDSISPVLWSAPREPVSLSWKRSCI